MFIKKGSSIGEKSQNSSEEQEANAKTETSNELSDYISQLVDSVHGRCATPSILEFISRSK
jgi:hypothetical protein